MGAPLSSDHVFKLATGRAQAQRDRQSVGVGQPVVSQLGVSADEVKDNPRQKDRPQGSKNYRCVDQELKAD